MLKGNRFTLCSGGPRVQGSVPGGAACIANQLSSAVPGGVRHMQMALSSS